MVRTLLRVARIALPLGLLIAAVSYGTAEAGGDRLADVRTATAKFHSVEAAHHAGYFDPGLPCFDDELAGAGMGIHLVNGGLLDDGGALDRDHPEALVYEVRSGSVKLVAVEYLVKVADHPTQPDFMGQPMIENKDLGLWTLHAWVWKDNPAGLFESYNLNVPLCPAS